MLRKTLYPKFETQIKNIVTVLNKNGITPNQLTLAGVAINLLAGVIYAKGFFFLGAIVLLLASLGDLLDGPLARLSGKVTRFGAFLDSSVDRYSDFFIFAGIAAYFAREAEVFWFFVSLGIVLGCFVVSYTKARAENFIENCGIGLFGRAERIFLLALGTLITPLLKIILLVLLVGTHVTAIQRILHTRKALSESKTPKN